MDRAKWVLPTASKSAILNAFRTTSILFLAAATAFVVEVYLAVSSGKNASGARSRASAHRIATFWRGGVLLAACSHR